MTDISAPLFKTAVALGQGLTMALLVADRAARAHYGGRTHRRLGVCHVDDGTVAVYYAQEPAA
jgi:hypothetical protein